MGQPPQADLGRGNGAGRSRRSGRSNSDTTTAGVIASIDSFYYRVANSANPNLTLDEVRVDTSWAGVTPISNASNPTWTGTSGGSWSGNNWGGNASPNAGSTFVYFGPNSSGAVSVDSNVSVGTMNFNGTASYNITGPATLTFDGARAGVDTVGALVQAAINVQPVIIGGVPQAATHTISANVTLASNTTSLHVNTGVNQTLTISGNIGETTPGSTLIKSGGGVLALTGSNNTTGGITVNDGTLRIDPAGNGLGSSNNLALFGGILELTSSTPFTTRRQRRRPGAACHLHAQRRAFVCRILSVRPWPCRGESGRRRRRCLEFPISGGTLLGPTPWSSTAPPRRGIWISKIRST